MWCHFCLDLAKVAPSLQHHHCCSSDPSPLLARPITLLVEPSTSTLSLSAKKSTTLQALTPPFDPWLCNLTSPPMVPPLSPPFSIDASVTGTIFFFSQNRRKIAKINRNKMIFLRNFPTRGDFLKKSPKFLFLPKFQRNLSDFWRNFWIFLPSTFRPPISFRHRLKHEISPKFRWKKQKFSSLVWTTHYKVCIVQYIQYILLRNCESP